MTVPFRHPATEAKSARPKDGGNRRHLFHRSDVGAGEPAGRCSPCLADGMRLPDSTLGLAVAVAALLFVVLHSVSVGETYAAALSAEFEAIWGNTE